MKIFDFFETIGKKSDEFSHSIVVIGQKIDNFSSSVIDVSDDITRAIDGVSAAIVTFSEKTSATGSSTDSFGKSVLDVASNFNTLVSAAKSFDALKIEKSIKYIRDLVIGATKATEYFANGKKFLTGVLNKTEIGKRTLAIGTGIYTAVKGAATKAKVLFNAAMIASPIGAKIAIVAALVAAIALATRAFSALSNAFSRNSRESARQAEALKEMRNENGQLIKSTGKLSTELQKNAANRANIHDDEMSRIYESQSANEGLLARLAELSSAENKTEADRRNMAEIVDKLNGSMEGLNLQIDEETGLLNQSLDVIGKQVSARYDLSRIDAERDKAIGIVEDKNRLNEELNQVLERQEYLAAKLLDTETYSYEMRQDIAAQKKELEKAANILRESYENLGDEYATIAEKIDDLTESMEATEAAAEAMYQAQRTALTALGERYQALEAHARNMFSVINTESEKTAQTFISNMRSNQEAMDEWAGNMDSLASRFSDLELSDEVLKHFREMELEGAGYVNNLVDATDEELRQLAYYWERGAQRAVQAAATVWDVDDSLVSQARDMVESTTQTIDDKLREAGFLQMGQYIPQSLADGMEGYSAQVDAEADKMAGLPGDIFKSKNLISSPSRLFIGYGKMIVYGLVNGIQSAERSLIRAVTTMVSEMNRTVNDAMRRMLDGVNNLLNSEGFNIGRSFFRSLGEGLINEQASLLTLAMQTAQSIRQQFAPALPGAFGADIGMGAMPLQSALAQDRGDHQTMGDIKQYFYGVREEQTAFQVYRATQKALAMEVR